MKFLRNYSEFIIIPIILIFTLFLSYFFYKKSEPCDYREFFANDKIHTISIKTSDADLKNLLDNPVYKTNYHADVSFDGEKFKDVAFSTRGNASLIQIAGSGTEKYSYKIKFDTFHKNQSFYGLDKLVLNSNQSDSSKIKDYMAYRLMAETEAEAPKMAFTELFLNDESRGVYLAIEGIDRSFAERGANSSEVALFKPSPTGSDQDLIRDRTERLMSGESLDIETIPESPDYDSEGADLVYRGDDPELYSAIFENEVFKTSPASRTRVIEAIKALAKGENVEEYWDIDSLARYFAAHNFIMNGDSYTGLTAQNYYLLLRNGRLSLLPWDYDLAYQGAWVYDQEIIDKGIINYSIDEPLMSVTPEERPLWKALSENPEFMDKYHARLQILIDNYVFSGRMDEEIDSILSRLESYVESDTTLPENRVEIFKNEVEYIRSFISARAESVQNQLWSL